MNIEFICSMFPNSTCPQRIHPRSGRHFLRLFYFWTEQGIRFLVLNFFISFLSRWEIWYFYIIFYILLHRCSLSVFYMRFLAYRQIYASLMKSWKNACQNLQNSNTSLHAEQEFHLNSQFLNPNSREHCSQSRSPACLEAGQPQLWPTWRERF